MELNEPEDWCPLLFESLSSVPNYGYEQCFHRHRFCEKAIKSFTLSGVRQCPIDKLHIEKILIKRTRDSEIETIDADLFYNETYMSEQGKEILKILQKIFHNNSLVEALLNKIDEVKVNELCYLSGYCHESLADLEASVLNLHLLYRNNSLIEDLKGFMKSDVGLKHLFYLYSEVDQSMHWDSSIKNTWYGHINRYGLYSHSFKAMHVILSRIKCELLKFNFLHANEFTEIFGTMPQEYCLICLDIGDVEYGVHFSCCANYICHYCRQTYELEEVQCPIHVVRVRIDDDDDDVIEVATETDFIEPNIMEEDDYVDINVDDYEGPVVDHGGDDSAVERVSYHLPDCMHQDVPQFDTSDKNNKIFIKRLQDILAKLRKLSQSKNYEQMKKYKSKIKNILTNHVNIEENSFEDDCSTMEYYNGKSIYSSTWDIDQLDLHGGFVDRVWMRHYKEELTTAILCNLEIIRSSNMMRNIPLIISAIQGLLKYMKYA